MGTMEAGFMGQMEDFPAFCLKHMFFDFWQGCAARRQKSEKMSSFMIEIPTTFRRKAEFRPNLYFTSVVNVHVLPQIFN